MKIILNKNSAWQKWSTGIYVDDQMFRWLSFTKRKIGKIFYIKDGTDRHEDIMWTLGDLLFCQREIPYPLPPCVC